MVKRYAKERIAQKYRNAVMNVITVLSDTEIRNLNLCICSIRLDFGLIIGLRRKPGFGGDATRG